MSATALIAYKRLYQNHIRCQRLIGLAVNLSPGTPVPAECMADIFRAVTVMVHATMEDFLRTLARDRLVSGDLRGVPFPGQGRAEKIHLAELTKYRGQSVDEVVTAAVDDYLARLTINSATDLEQLLRQIRLDVEPCKRLFPALESLMQRRHKIVHNADFAGPQSKEPQPFTIRELQVLGAGLLAMGDLAVQLMPAVMTVEPDQELLDLIETFASLLRDFHGPEQPPPPNTNPEPTS